ncbi:MAG: fumarylacetoacetate hydrolase family protein [Burkholderiaceae bacterium]|nr:fumarylacetoacetate hydrolase family protein [Burkholderiaceae bacterium]
MTQFGAELYEAWAVGRAVQPITDREPAITIQEAYQIQLETVRLREASGSRIVGKKIGVTSNAVMEMLKVDQPDFGHMLSDMAYRTGEVVSLNKALIPRGEGEIAFVLKHDLTGPGLTNADVLNATDRVVPCFEIVDSRIRDWKIKIQDTVADNGSSFAYVLGDTSADPRQIDLVNVRMVLEKNGEVIGTGTGAATMGNPVTAVTWLANTLGRLGIPLRAGEVILSGSLSIMFAVAPGDSIRMSLEGIGSCEATFA